MPFRLGSGGDGGGGGDPDGGGGGPGYVVPSGEWHGPDVTYVTTNVGQSGQMRLHPVQLTDQTWDRIGFTVETGSAGSSYRLGVYEYAADGLPGALLLDSGSLGGDTAGWVTAVINLDLSSRWVFVATLIEAEGADLRVIKSATNVPGMPERAQAGVHAGTWTCWMATGVASGALPDPCPSGLILFGNSPKILLRAA